MASEAPDDAPALPETLMRRKRRRALSGVGALIAGLTLVWVMRAPIADNFVESQFEQRDVQAAYRVVSIGPRTQTLADVVIGDPQRPDLIARRVEVDIGWGWSGPVIVGLRADGVRLFGRWQDGRLALGEVDKLLPPPSAEPFTLPDLDVALVDARARIDTPWGAIGARLDGAGGLRDSFHGQVALASEGIAAGGCRTGRVTAFGTLRTTAGRPGFAGPVRAADMTCDSGAFTLARFDARLDAALAADLSSWTGQGDATASDMKAAGGSLASLTAKGGFRGSSASTEVNYDVTGSRGRFGDISIGGLSLVGGLNTGGEMTASAKLAVAQVTAPRQLLESIANSAAALRESPIGPIADQLLRAAAGALTSLSGETDVLLIGDTQTRRIEIIAPRLRSASGARVTGDATSRLSVLLAGKAPLLLLDGRWQLEGGGLPDASVQVRRSGDGQINGQANIKPLVAGASRLALTPMTIAGERSGRLRLTTTASLSGPLAGGWVDGLTMPLDAQIQPDGDFTLAEGCRQVTLASAQLADLQLGKNVVQLCSESGRPLLAYRGGRLSGDLALIEPVLRGRTGASALLLQAARLNYALATGAMSLDALAIQIGEGEPATNFSAASVTATISAGTTAGRLDGAAGEIGEIPLDMTEISGDWKWQSGALTLKGGLLVTDQQPAPRFAPLISRDANLTFADGKIAATAGFAEQSTNTSVGRADIVHDFARAAGAADLVVMAMRFNEAFQPDQLTPLALGIVANASGTLAGRGRIDWMGDDVTSSGTLTTAGSDFAAAFGSVNGASTTIIFDDLLALHTPPGQRISLDEVNPGIPVIGGLIDYQLLDANQIRIEGGRWPFAGGELTLKPTVIDFDVNAVRRLEFELHGVDAAIFLSEFGFDNLSAKGVFDGVLPVEFSGLGGRIVDGKLVARRGGGEVAYVGELTNYNLGVFANYAFNMLKSLSYDEMTITLNGDLDGEMLTDVKIVGLGQGEGATRNIITRQIAKLPIIFNVRINAPFRQLIGSARSLYNPSVLIDQNRDALIEAQRAAEEASVQPPESEPVP